MDFGPTRVKEKCRRLWGRTNKARSPHKPLLHFLEHPCHQVLTAYFPQILALPASTTDEGIGHISISLEM